MNNICVDTGFLIGLYDQSDQHHELAAIHFDDYFRSAANHLVVPYPIIYETLSTRFVKNRNAMMLLNQDWTRLVAEKRLELVSDAKYRETLADECFLELERPLPTYRALSAVDRLVRRVLSDVELRIEAFITFNPKDFADVCAQFKRVLLN